MIAKALLFLFVIWAAVYMLRGKENFDMSQLVGHSFEMKGQQGLHQLEGGNFYFYVKNR